MHTDTKLFIVAEWDAEAGVWYVADTNVPGLATEAPTIDTLLGKLKVMVPEMLELNGVSEPDHGAVPFSLMAEISGADGHC